jgi:hypothetical protein
MEPFLGPEPRRSRSSLARKTPCRRHGRPADDAAYGSTFRGAGAWMPSE